MKANIHPTWFDETTVSCVCGASYSFGSTKQSYQVEICAKCHPFFTGEMKFVDTLGRVERFQARQKYAATQAPALSAKKKKKNQKTDDGASPKSLREMLMGAK